jgi:2-polyprenyl-6-methoxyphenol hydroxylase-like FAD-dependent oxidoreductase
MMINHTPVERINKIYVHDHDPIQTWYKHNLILIGDAAHAALPASGQGACQALEDAWHLSNILNDNPHDLQKYFLKFTEIRFEKTAGITMAGRGLLHRCSIGMKNSVWQEMKTAKIRTLPKLPQPCL